MMAAPVQQEEPCTLANERDRERMPSNKLQSAMYYALDGDQVNILTMLAQKCEDFWVTIRIYIPNLFLYDFFLDFVPRMWYSVRGNLSCTQRVNAAHGNAPSFS